MTSTDLPAPSTVLRMSDLGELIASVPVLIGFRPCESLVLIALGGASRRRIGLTLRIDLPPPEHVHDIAAHAVACLQADDVDGAVVVVFGAAGGTGPARPDVAAAAVAALEDQGIRVHAAAWAERAEAGRRWACFDACGCGGLLPDPAATEAAATAVVEGKVVRTDREALRALVEPVDATTIRRRERRVIEAADEALAAPEPGVDGDAIHLAVVRAALADTATGRLELDDERAVALAVALARPAVRDAALAMSDPDSPDGGAAETLWAALCRELPDPEAAEAAALLAASALMRGDGALANVALDRAEHSWPGHRLTGLLRSVATCGMRPSQLRACLLDGPGS
ncbi:DUF4192 domain-containing protein [Pseudonocardia sp.]|uniref:DUF4192 domain-containing protein n=1 Tax=Pseudonocardia sp. TaxID=60912 RepID=UPI002606BD62|nr:DUF4192 domain-containing protein [Pseudonocardia sp.]